MRNYLVDPFEYIKHFRQNGYEDVDPRFFEQHRKGKKMMVVHTSRGCTHRCTFCQRHMKGIRMHSMEFLFDYLELLMDKYNVGFFSLGAELFLPIKRFYWDFIEEVKRRKLDILFYVTGARVNTVDRDILFALKEIGCWMVEYGFESGSQKMLDIMEKKFTVDDIKKAIFACYDIGLYSNLLGFMIGMPGENLRTVKGSGKLLGEFAAYIRVPVDSIFSNSDIPYAAPLVGTPLYEYGKQLGLIGSSVDEEEKFLEATSNISYYKRFYINFNGAPMSEVVFWEILIFLEASRTYDKLMKNKTVNEELRNKFIRQLKIRDLNPQASSKQKRIKIMGAASEKKLDLSFSQYFISNFLKQHIVFNKVVAKLPRFLVDPIVRYLLYFEYLMQRHLLKDTHNVHRRNAKGNSKIRIEYDQIDPLKTTQKDRSLRSIVTKKMAQLQRTEQEKTASILTAGP